MTRHCEACSPHERSDMRGTGYRFAHPGYVSRAYADFWNNSRPISMRRISLVPAPIS
jgi:hypothetical protein